MTSHQIQDILLMYEAVYNNELREMVDEYNNSLNDDDIIEVATEYFYNYGLNSHGIAILVEKVGLDNFIDFIYNLSEDLITLTEAKRRAKKRRAGSPSLEEVKRRIDEKEAAAAAKKEARKKASEAARKRVETERKQPETKGPDTEAKQEQPKSKPEKDGIGAAIRREFEKGRKRHVVATTVASRVAKELAPHVVKGFGGALGIAKHVTTKGLNEEEEFDTFDYILEYLIMGRYADTHEDALAIMTNMSEDWKQDIMNTLYE